METNFKSSQDLNEDNTHFESAQVLDEDSTHFESAQDLDEDNPQFETDNIFPIFKEDMDPINFLFIAYKYLN